MAAAIFVHIGILNIPPSAPPLEATSSMDKQRPAVRGALPVESSLALWECPRPAAELIVGRMSTGVFCRATGRAGLRMRGSGSRASWVLHGLTSLAKAWASAHQGAGDNVLYAGSCPLVRLDMLRAMLIHTGWVDILDSSRQQALLLSPNGNGIRPYCYVLG